MAIAQKIVSGNDQPSGGNGVVSIGGARGLGNSGTLLAEITTTNIVSPFPPIQDTQLDQTVSVINVKLDSRFDDVAYYNQVDGGGA